MVLFAPYDLFRQRDSDAVPLTSPPLFVQIVRSKVAMWFLARPDANKTGTAADFRDQLDALADDRQLMQSATLLAHHRPLFTAAITGKLFTPLRPVMNWQERAHLDISCQLRQDPGLVVVERLPGSGS